MAAPHLSDSTQVLLPDCFFCFGQVHSEELSNPKILISFPVLRVWYGGSRLKSQGVACRDPPRPCMRNRTLAKSELHSQGSGHVGGYKASDLVKGVTYLIHLHLQLSQLCACGPTVCLRSSCTCPVIGAWSGYAPAVQLYLFLVIVCAHNKSRKRILCVVTSSREWW